VKIFGRPKNELASARRPNDVWDGTGKTRWVFLGVQNVPDDRNSFGTVPFGSVTPSRVNVTDYVCMLGPKGIHPK
jgi:hypothetical protein